MPLLVNCSCGPASVLNLEATWNSHWSCVAELQLLCKESVALWKCTTEEHSMYLSRPDATARWLCLCLPFFLQVGEFSGQQLLSDPSGTTLLLTHPSLTSMMMCHSATRWHQRAAQIPTLESSICPNFRKTSRKLVLCTSRTALSFRGFCSGPFRMPTPSISFQHLRETQGSEAFSCRSPGQHPALSGCLSDPLTCLP